MPSYQQIKKRREKMQTYLARGILTPKKLADVMKVSEDTVRNDLKFFKKDSLTWLKGLAVDGFTFQAQNTMDQLQDMLEELQQKRTLDRVKNSVKMLVLVDKEIAHILGLQWQIASTGPTLMNVQKAQQSLENQNLIP